MNDMVAGSLLDVPLSQKSLDQITLDSVEAIEKKGSAIHFACANPHSLVESRKDEKFRSALQNASFVVADGVGITIVTKFAHIHAGPRITGTDYFLSIMSALNERGTGRVFFFGSSQKVLDLIVNKLERDYPMLTVCGTFSPPFGAWSDEENKKMIETINAARPDVLWVGMTAPKQEKWVEANRNLLNVPVIGSIGAVFDFYAGTYSRAPQWICKLGIEWLYRLLKEPRRMWRRTFVSTPKYLWYVFLQHILKMSK